ncbi:helix-turn-helix domain-containing protein [Shimwellia pseudoproteus]|uniref:GlxA family transcriptional regulator n=1 Tax=Shimwellia pseudoproteus TaxID=570012 RepID=UPI0018EB06D4|nr:helix-turn-helix domain-containing protein [Shimwellia pseudoproteus]MBJ3816102.1 helix-turn-helix domain-containing protein [Shimwellia pseudoproteus]
MPHNIVILAVPGVQLLDVAGPLDQRRVTTHWAACAELAARFPAISVDADALYVADGPVRTAAGVTSGMDLALRLIEEDVGQEVARDVAARLVMFFRRPAGQGHFMRQQGVSVAGRSALQDLQRWVLSNLHQVSGIQDMASHIQRSPRHLNRLFRQQMGMSCGEWLEGARIAKARELLTGPLPAKSVAAACGYRSSDVLRRAFSKVTGMTPSVYRKMYRAAPS